MDEADLDFSNPDAFPGPHVNSEDPPSSCSMDSFFDEILKDTQHHACTHTHTCNPPGRDLSHTHTCFHVHTKILSATADESAESSEQNPNTSPNNKNTNNSSKKRPFGNREAVRKYREKKKAHTASLEDEVVQLRAVNQQLMKRLQNQSALESEIARLKCLLVDIRGRIEGEIGSFPYNNNSNKPDLINLNVNGGQVINSCDFRCDERLYNCLSQGKVGGESGINGPGFRVCEVANLQCMGNPGPFGCSPNAEQK